METLERGLNILVIHEVGYLAKPVYEYQDFAERLAGKGHNVIVIDFNEAVESTFSSQMVSRTGEGQVELLSLPNNGIPLFNILRAKIFFNSLLKRVIREKKIDAVLLYSVFVNGYSTARLCKLLGVPVVYRVLDAYHKLRANRLESWLLLQGEKYIYRHVSALSVTNDKMADYVRSIAGHSLNTPVSVTDHGVDTLHFRRHVPSATLAYQLGLSVDDCVCVFLGTTYGFSRLDQLAAHIPQIKRQIPRFKLLVIGAGELDAKIAQGAREAGVVGDVIQTGMIAYSDLPAYLSLADFAINTFEINDITRDIIPIKILQYLASELAVVSTPLPDVRRKIPAQSSGVFYSESDGIEDFVKYLVEFASTMDMRQTGATGRNYVSEHHSMHRVMAELEGLLGV